MLSLNLDTKLIIGAVCGLALLAAIAGAALYHESQLSHLRGQLETARAERQEALARGEKLNRLLLESSAEVQAANRAATAAQKQARCVGGIARLADRTRARNREVVHEVRNSTNAAPNLAASQEAERLARAAYWARLNELFLRHPGASPAPAADPGTPGLLVPAAP